MDATLEHVKSVAISLHAFTKKVYDQLVEGNFSRIRRNIIHLAENKPSDMQVELIFVLFEQNAQFVREYIDITAKLGFNAVTIKRGTDCMVGKLPQQSFLPKLSSVFDLDELSHYAMERGIVFNHDEIVYNKGVFLCKDPWTRLDCIVEKDGWSVGYCCRNRINISISNEGLRDVERLWRNERISFVRKTVNSPELLPANKMCTLCRMCANNPESRPEDFFDACRMKNGEAFPHLRV